MQSQIVLREGKSNKVTNTNRAYDPKMLEFQQFCHSVYGNTLDAQLVTEERNFAFLYYQAHRVRKDAKSRKSCRDTAVQRFDRSDYDEVMRNVDKDVENSEIGDVLGFSVVNQYRCAIKNFYATNVIVV